MRVFDILERPWDILSVCLSAKLMNSISSERFDLQTLNLVCGSFSDEAGHTQLLV